MSSLEKDPILNSRAVLKKNPSLLTGADSPELAPLAFCDVWTRAGPAAALHSAARSLAVRSQYHQATGEQRSSAASLGLTGKSVTALRACGTRDSVTVLARAKPAAVRGAILKKKKKKLKARYVQQQPQGVLEQMCQTQ